MFKVCVLKVRQSCQSVLSGPPTTNKTLWTEGVTDHNTTWRTGTVPSIDRSEFETYRNALQANSNILAIAGAKTSIFSAHTHEPIRYATLPMEADIIEVGDNYLQAMDVKLLEGRDFRKDSQTDQRESVIITRKLADRFGWIEVFPNRLYPGRMLVSSMQQVDRLNVSIMYSYAFLGIVAMLLSATGLFTLLSLNIIKRTKELGIRKILGASTVSISRIVNTEFAIILLVASLLGA